MKAQLQSQRGSVLIMVLWLAFGLVGLALYFANSMNFELRSADSRVSAQAADEAIEGAARYLTYLLATQAANGSNGVMPDPAGFPNTAVPVGDAHYWLIGRDTNTVTGPGNLFCGLVDEASKLNLNYASSNALYWLPRMTVDLTQGILDWRDTNGGGPTTTYYAMQQPSYQCKNYPFETIDELRLVYGADMDMLVGEDSNRNGLLDPNENDDNQNNIADPGILEYVTVYSREPNTNASRINISSLRANGSFSSLLVTNFGTTRANAILARLGLSSPAGNRGGGRPGQPAPAQTGPPVTFASPLQLFVRSQMTSAEFAQISSNLTVSTNSFIEGRVNVNTASVAVLTCLMNGDSAAAQQVVNYRLANPNNQASIAWVVDALGGNYASALTALQAGDYITTHTYQFTADIAALGPHGRGYRRVKFIFDTSSGSPQIVYRQDLTHLGWALGSEARKKYLRAQGTS